MAPWPQRVCSFSHLAAGTCLGAPGMCPGVVSGGAGSCLSPWSPHAQSGQRGRETVTSTVPSSASGVRAAWVVAVPWPHVASGKSAGSECGSESRLSPGTRGLAATQSAPSEPSALGVFARRQPLGSGKPLSSPSGHRAGGVDEGSQTEHTDPAQGRGEPVVGSRLSPQARVCVCASPRAQCTARVAPARRT